jgi:hypothetical protein
MLVSDPSLRHMAHVLAEGADGGGAPLYFFTAWPWARVWGASELSLRLYSAAGFCVALVVLWRLLRRSCGSQATAFGILAAFFTWQPLLYQVGEARFYGLFTACVALAIADAGRALTGAPTTGWGRVRSTAIQAGLVSSHYLGIVYGGLILTALVLWDLRRRTPRPALYASFAAGWGALLLWVKPLLKLRELSQPRGWIPPPAWADLSAAIPWHLAVVLAAMLLLARLRPNAVPPRSALGWLGAHLLLAPLLVYAVSLCVSPLFVTRYFVPVAVGWSLLLATAAEGLWSQAEMKGRWPLAVRGALVSLVLAYPLAYGRYGVTRTDPSAALLRSLPRKEPVVVQDLRSFLALAFAARQSREAVPTYLFPLDEALASDPRAPYDALCMFRVAQKLKDLGFWSGQFVDGTALRCEKAVWAVLDSPSLSWRELRIDSDPGFTCTPLGMLEGRALWEVSWRDGEKPPSCSGSR